MGLRRQLGRVAGLAARGLPLLRWPLRIVALAAIVAIALLPSAWRGDLSVAEPGRRRGS